MAENVNSALAKTRQWNVETSVKSAINYAIKNITQKEIDGRTKIMN